MTVPYRIELPYACFWIEVNEAGVVVEAPPIAHWMVGKSIATVQRFVRRKVGEFVRLAG